MKDLRLWPHLVVAVVCAVLAGVGVALWMKHERVASAESMPDAARIQSVQGDVAINNGVATNDNSQANQWYAATQNQPFSVGDRIYTRENSRAGLAFSGRNFARLNPNTSLDVLALDPRRTQLALRDGSAMFDVGYLGNGDLYEVATPYGAVDFEQPGLYNVGIDNGRVLVSVLSGLAQVVGLGGSGQISKGEMLTLLGQTAADVVLSRLDGRQAGYLVDDYYSYQYPRYYDGRYRDYNVYLNDPYYFDPYRRYISYQYVNSYIPGLDDLDYYGDWRNVSGYGYCWEPRVDSGWGPYQSGYWMTDYPYGPTWVSTEPWGYAPYHYGRWAFVGDRWYWVPDATSVTPVYSPALVAFVPFGQNDVGWVPLGPGDVYVPHYYNNNWQPYYLTRDNLYERVVNLNVPGAVTVTSVDDFTRGTDWRHARRADRNMLAQVNPVLDPLLLTPLRNAVIHSAWGRGKKDIPPGIAKKLQDTTVITSTTPAAPPFGRNLARTTRVESVPDRVRGQKFNVRDERQEQAASQPANAPPMTHAPQVTRGPEAARGPEGVRGPEAARGPEVVRRPEAARGQRAESARIERSIPPAPAKRPAPIMRAERGGPPARVERGGPPVRESRGAPVTRQAPQVVQRKEQPRNQRQVVAPQAERTARPVQQRPAPPAAQAERAARPVQPHGERVGRPVERPQPAPAKAQPKHEQKQQDPPPKTQPTPGGGGKGKGKPGKP